jgi:hypothetical protein
MNSADADEAYLLRRNTAAAETRRRVEELAQRSMMDQSRPRQLRRSQSHAQLVDFFHIYKKVYQILRMFERMDKVEYDSILEKYGEDVLVKSTQILVNVEPSFLETGIPGIENRLNEPYYEHLDPSFKQLISRLLENDKFMKIYKYVFTPRSRVNRPIIPSEYRQRRVTGGKKTRKNKRKNRKTLRK